MILQHALKDEENLEIALRIGAAYADLCSRVIAGFLEIVANKLASRLGGNWKIRVGDVGQLAARWATFLEANLLGHTGQFGVVVGGDESGYPKQVYFAVRSTDGKEHHERVKATIDERYAKGSKSDFWLWYRYVDKAYSYWGSEDVTLLLYRKDEAVDYFVTRLEQVARAIELALTPAESTDVAP